MGSRGPLQRVHSIRGERAAKREKRQKAAPPAETPISAPTWLNPAAAALFDTVVGQLRAAGVHLETVDQHAIGAYATTAVALQGVGSDPKELSRLSKDLLAWANVIGASPMARARLGIKPPAPKKPDDPWDQFFDLP